jgi:addiction module HigA family antidote
MTRKAGARKPRLSEPIHPGEILREDFMKPLGLSINRLARELSVPPGRVSAIVAGKRAITADTALRLGRYFGVTPQFWLNLQSEHDLRLARQTGWREMVARIRPLAG